MDLSKSPSRTLLKLACIIEAATGLALLATPDLVVTLLMGGRAEGLVKPVSWILGGALVALSIACWPRADGHSFRQQTVAMAAYSGGAGLVLVLASQGGLGSGILLWPTSVLHFVMALTLLIGAARSQPTA